MVLMLSSLTNVKRIQQLMPLLEEHNGGIVVAPAVVMLEQGTVITSATTGGATPTFCQRWLLLDALNRFLQPFDLWHTAYTPPNLGCHQ